MDDKELLKLNKTELRLYYLMKGLVLPVTAEEIKIFQRHGNIVDPPEYDYNKYPKMTDCEFYYTSYYIIYEHWNLFEKKRKFPKKNPIEHLLKESCRRLAEARDIHAQNQS